MSRARGRSALNEMRENERLLKAAGYKDPKAYAARLVREGIGPEELRDRMRWAYGSVGSLNYTHGFVKR